MASIIFAAFTTPMDNHRGPIFYYVPAVLAGMFPWSIFAVPGMLYVIRGFAIQQATPAVDLPALLGRRFHWSV
ncbi:MAG: hypothetical protein R3C99_01630 [Pirellulaceae bacterium]